MFTLGIIGTEDVVFSNCKTRDEYTPPSAGRIGGLASRLMPSLKGAEGADALLAEEWESN